MSGMGFLEFKGVSKGYGVHPVLRHLVLSVREGEYLAILGFSGSGKTTLLNLMAGLVMPDMGEVQFKGAPVTGPGRGLVFLSYALIPWLTVAGHIGLAVHAVHRGRSRADRAALVAKYIAMVGLGFAAERRPSRLSGGTRQRVAKVGLGWCQAQICDPQMRAGLSERFMLSQSFCQKDPQAELAADPAVWAPMRDMTRKAAE